MSAPTLTLVRNSCRHLVMMRADAKSNSNDSDSDKEESIEEVRKRLLASIVGSNSSNDNDKNDNSEKNTLAYWRRELERSPPLTTIGRERILVEMSLLEGLVTSAVVDEELAQRRLWYYWYNERGRTNTATLMEADQLVQRRTPEAWKLAEDLYRDLIVREGVNWAEPLNRLATLLYYDERYAEAKDLCQMVLALKPWHFGCQTGIVMVCEKMGDVHGVEYYSRLRMPPRGENGNDEERTEWVNRMLDQARVKLTRGEKTTQEYLTEVEQNGNDDDDNTWA